MFEHLLRRATILGARRGLGGSNAWMVVAILAVGARVLRRLANPEPEVLYRTRIRPGDRFEISAREPG
ncbi:MAG: hypothetical protein KatS3mg010_0335 [Acidimicrobiia bacterium]|nr:MAG: hypothetical protein KatS3mg010_0335 [Acidimicrobiia bacterium]